MKAVMLMFDSLNRTFLPAYGCDWTHLPNFQRLEARCQTFDNFYAGSLPCMPARRELHTGKYNFLHRSWGPLEPFDDSAIERLKESGVYTHLASDHTHYWEDGGGTYHTRYNTWQQSRGQEGDPWMGQVRDPEIPAGSTGHKVGSLWRQDWINRPFLDSQEKMPQTQTVNNGLDFIRRNAKEDRWFLQIELFDPHEPFFAPEKFRELYPHAYEGVHLDWPNYGTNSYDDAATAHIQKEYAALLSMCDESLGRLLDLFDEKNLWRDTMLIVNTDHGFLLGEKDWMGKNIMPCYNEIVHTPFFIWDPRYGKPGGRRQALAQTVDIAPTLLGFFGAKPFEDIDGEDLAQVIRKDRPVRRAAMFGTHGGHVSVTDGEIVFMRAPVDSTNGPLYDYTLMPTHMNARFKVEELAGAELATLPKLAPCPVLKVPAISYVNAYWYGDLLFDLKQDPMQEHPFSNLETTVRMLNLLCEVMRRNGAPEEQYERLGLPLQGVVDESWLNGPGAHREFQPLEAIAETRMTDGAKKGVSILMSLTPPEMQGKLLGLIKVAAMLPGTFNEDKLYGLLKKFLPTYYGVMAVNIIGGYLKYQTTHTMEEK